MVKGKTVRNDLSRSNGPKVSVASSWKDMRAILKEGRWGLSKHRHRLGRMAWRFLRVLIDTFNRFIQSLLLSPMTKKKGLMVGDEKKQSRKYYLSSVTLMF